MPRSCTENSDNLEESLTKVHDNHITNQQGLRLMMEWGEGGKIDRGAQAERDEVNAESQMRVAGSVKQDPGGQVVNGTKEHGDALWQKVTANQ